MWHHVARVIYIYNYIYIPFLADSTPVLLVLTAKTPTIAAQTSRWNPESRLCWNPTKPAVNWPSFSPKEDQLHLPFWRLVSYIYIYISPCKWWYDGKIHLNPPFSLGKFEWPWTVTITYGFRSNGDNFLSSAESLAQGLYCYHLMEMISSFYHCGWWPFWDSIFG